MDSFWKNLKKPFFVLAPMADATDPAFRHLIASYKSADVMWTEFVSADGLYHTREIQKIADAENPLMLDLQYSEAERPIVAQLFTHSPDMMEYAARLVAELGFDGVDINMGCPDRSVMKQKAGAELIRYPEQAVALISAAKKSGLPVSVKTRLGYNKDELETWLPTLLSAEPSAVTIHARTKKELSLVPARWDRIARAVEIRDAHKSAARIIGNGDVQSIEDARAKIAATHADGAMIGRAVFGRPWLFDERVDESTLSLSDRLSALLAHTDLYEKLLPHKHFIKVRRMYKSYVSGFDGAKELRDRLMHVETAAEVREVITQFIQDRQ